jgi:hypothetical protein
MMLIPTREMNMRNLKEGYMQSAIDNGHAILAMEWMLGNDIQFEFFSGGGWHNVDEPAFGKGFEYRLSPVNVSARNIDKVLCDTCMNNPASIITDIMHWCDVNNVNFDKTLKTARGRYRYNSE